MLYGSQALGHQRARSDIDLYLEAPSMELGELLLLWQIDLQLRHLIAHEGLLAHIERAGQLLWERPPNAKPPQPTL